MHPFTNLAFPDAHPEERAASSHRYTPAVLDAARHRTDPLADAAWVELAETGKPHRNPAQAVRAYASEGRPACQALIEQYDTRPDWVEFERMRPGNEVCLRHVFPAGLALLTGSLVESYVNWRGVKVLMQTGRLAHDTYKRLVETMQFVSNIGVNRGPRPGTPSYEETLGVRLMHAWVRRMVYRSGQWDGEAWGAPINQEDQLWTLLLFSHVFRRAFEMQGIRLTPEEHDAIHHCWRYTGHLLGIEKALLPTTCDEETEAYCAIAVRHYVPDADSRLLTAKLLHKMAYHPPFFLPPSGLAALARRALTPKLADALALPQARGWRPVLDGLARFNRGQQRLRNGLPGTGRTSVRVGEWVVRATQRYGAKRATEYALPAQAKPGHGA